jgi:nicotinamide riboside kinase
MKILATGTFCSGKTTLALQMQAQLDDVTLLADHCRDILDLYHDVDWTLPELRDYLLVRQLFAEKQSCSHDTITIVDSGIISNLAHDRVLLDHQRDRSHLIRSLEHEPYDVVFHCDYRDIELADDGQRFTDVNLRERLDREVVYVLDMLHYTTRIFLTGSKEERLKRALSYVSQWRNQ